ncbi:Sporulation and spore germination [Paenibacillus sp. 1_12]|uniref:GerMN domain-containing protein n=1 Tax=Paenibacillus sp. 1_12 TaxID=1566278 RepID=UPI0008F2D85C|nr:GerMN domain-containing protein [Paenibacillus sp. 1_12]SFK90922.1 Sporulation and spore germination [Paenibacillus sp. 1_12]
MQYRLLRNTIVSIGMLALLSACGQAKAPAEQPLANPALSKPMAASSNPTSAPPLAPTPVTSAPDNNKQMKIKAYFGDESGEKLVEQETNISYQQDDEKYIASLKALSVSSDSKKLALFRGFTFHSAAANKGLLTINVTMAPESRLGSGGEELLLQALKKTVFQFPEINSIELLVDGKSVESLMGHMDLPHPIKR